MEGYALSAVVGALVVGFGAWLTLGRNAITKREHADVCTLMQAPVKKDIAHLQAGHDRVETKVDAVSTKMDAVNTKVDAVNVKVDTTLAVLNKMNGDA